MAWLCFRRRPFLDPGIGDSRAALSEAGLGFLPLVAPALTGALIGGAGLALLLLADRWRRALTLAVVLLLLAPVPTLVLNTARDAFPGWGASNGRARRRDPLRTLRGVPLPLPAVAVRSWVTRRRQLDQRRRWLGLTGWTVMAALLVIGGTASLIRAREMPQASDALGGSEVGLAMFGSIAALTGTFTLVTVGIVAVIEILVQFRRVQN